MDSEQYYICREHEGYVAFYSGEELLYCTSTPVTLLPVMDAAALRGGIYLLSRTGCTKIYENFCS